MVCCLLSNALVIIQYLYNMVLNLCYRWSRVSYNLHQKFTLGSETVVFTALQNQWQCEDHSVLCLILNVFVHIFLVYAVVSCYVILRFLRGSLGYLWGPQETMHYYIMLMLQWSGFLGFLSFIIIIFFIFCTTKQIPMCERKHLVYLLLPLLFISALNVTGKRSSNQSVVRQSL